jgi:hypothetical protein
MAKKSSQSTSSGGGIFNFRNLLAILLIVAAAGWWIVERNPNVYSVLGQYIDNGEILTLEARYTPEKIMEQFGQEFIADGDRSFQGAELRFYPYALLDVKYSAPDKKTREGVLLWSLFDGEMVIDCKSWAKTHGFEDAINAQANRNDFKLLNVLARNKGKASFDQLQQELQIESNLLQQWVDDGKSKHLVLQKGNEVQLHFQDPRLLVSPQTSINECMVTKPYSHAQKVARNYSFKQIEKTAHAAFGDDFTIRSKKELYLPVYVIEVLNPDGSILTTEWNALNGQRLIPRYLKSQ